MLYMYLTSKISLIHLFLNIPAAYTCMYIVNLRLIKIIVIQSQAIKLLVVLVTECCLFQLLHGAGGKLNDNNITMNTINHDWQ